MSVRLRYDLTGPGWVDCTVEIDGQQALATASYLSDALDDLCRATIEVLRGEASARASFAEEPGEFLWLLDGVAPDRLRVRIVWYGGGGRTPPDEHGRTVLDAECRLRTFAGALLSELQRLLREYGEEGYREQWILHEFPRRRLAQLRELLS